MPYAAARTATRDEHAGRYQRHRPEQTLLYQIVEAYYPEFKDMMAMQGKSLPFYVQQEVVAQKDKLDSQIETWEKQLETEKAKLKEQYAEAKNQQASDDLKEEASSAAERNIETLREKIAQAKVKVDELVES